MKTGQKKKHRALLVRLLAGAVVALFAGGCASQQSQAQLKPAASGPAPQITGSLGSPSATTTISGEQLPAPPGQFGHVISY